MNWTWQKTRVPALASLGRDGVTDTLVFGARAEGEVFVLTTVDGQLHGHLLHNGPQPGEGCKAAVVAPAVLFLHVREVQVPLLAHVHPLVLLDVLQFWGEGSVVKWGDGPWPGWVAQFLRASPPQAEAAGSIPGQGTHRNQQWTHE